MVVCCLRSSEEAFLRPLLTQTEGGRRGSLLHRDSFGELWNQKFSFHRDCMALCSEGKETLVLNVSAKDWRVPSTNNWHREGTHCLFIRFRELPNSTNLFSNDIETRNWFATSIFSHCVCVYTWVFVYAINTGKITFMSAFYLPD